MKAKKKATHIISRKDFDRAVKTLRRNNKKERLCALIPVFFENPANNKWVCTEPAHRTKHPKGMWEPL